MSWFVVERAKAAMSCWPMVLVTDVERMVLRDTRHVVVACMHDPCAAGNAQGVPAAVQRAQFGTNVPYSPAQ